MINGIGTSVSSSFPALTGAGVARTSAPGVTAAEDKAAVTTTIGQLAAGGAPVDADRVGALKAAIKAGSYRPDPAAIAGSMITSDLGASL